MIIELETLTVRALMERSFSKYGNLPAIAFAGESPKTYNEVHAEVQKLSAGLLSRNVQKGDRVGILGENCPNWVIAYLAITYIGAVAVPILTGFPDADTRHILRNSECVALFIASRLRTKIEGMEKSSLHSVYSLEDFSLEEWKSSHSNLLEKTIQLIHKRTGEKPDHKDILSELPGPLPEDLAVIIYTSGTTGNSKGVMLSHYNIVSDVILSIEKFPITHEDRFLSILPLAHTFEATGGMLCPLAVGVSIYYLQGLPTPQKLLAGMETVKPTGVLTVPLVVDKIYRKKIVPQLQGKKVIWALYHIPLFRRLLNKVAGRKLVQSLGGALRFFMFGGASLNEDVEIFLRDADISYSTGYGMTETSPIMTINPFGRVKVGSCGQPIPELKIKIHNPDPETGIGEIIVKGPMIMQGYYKNPKATDEVFTEDGWLRTGDLGFLDSDGYLFIKGRSKNVIIGPSGENIYPEIIEQLMLQNPYIQQIIVYESQGKIRAKTYLDADMVDQEAEKAGITTENMGSFKETLLEEIRKETNDQLPGFSAISKIIEQPEPFEMTPTNKVKRYLYI